MTLFSSFRSRLQAAFLALGLTAIGLTDWQAASGATAALRQATYDRLTAIRETRCRQIERYFQDLGNHVLALSNDDSTIRALEAFEQDWGRIETTANESPADSELRRYYREQFAPTVARDPDGPRLAAQWYPADGRTRTLQHLFLAANPHPVGSKDLLLDAPGDYGRTHARYHPTFHRYQSAFGFYDLFLIGKDPARVLYTVFKEIDLGVNLDEAPHRDTPLAAVYRNALAREEPEQYVVQDYEPYLPSHLTPAAFVAAPVWRAGAKIGVLAIQVSVEEVNRVMTAGGRWREEGLGDTGHAYITGPDGTLRSDVRRRIENPERYIAELRQAGIAESAIDDVTRHGTAILRLRVAPEAAREHHQGPGTGIGLDTRGVAVLRSHDRLNVPGLDWSLMAEIEEREAFAPVRALRNRILGVGVLIAAVFLAAAAFLARTVTRPVQVLADGARRLGSGDFGTRLAISSRDEIGQLAESFNRMAASLERTTVSKIELEKLAGKLINAQEDERSRVARELHDDVTQRMAAIAIEAGALEHLPAQANTPLREGLRRIREHIGRLSTDIHAMSRRLHPALLDDLGLAAAIEAECRTSFELGGPPVEFDLDGDVDAAPREIRLAFYRIAQEALRNIRRHAGAESARVRVSLGGGQARLEIEDDGRGFDHGGSAFHTGLGLASMEERVRLLGGQLTVRTSPGAGTRIEVRAPLERKS